MIAIDELFEEAWCSVVADRVIDLSPTTLTPRQKSEIHYFMNEVERPMIPAMLHAHRAWGIARAGN